MEVEFHSATAQKSASKFFLCSHNVDSFLSQNWIHAAGCHDLLMQVVRLPRPFLAGCFGRHDLFSQVSTTFSCGLFWSSQPFLTCCHDLFLRVVLVATTFSCGLFWSPRPFLAGCFGRHDLFTHVATTFSCGLFWSPTTFSCGLFWLSTTFSCGLFWSSCGAGLGRVKWQQCRLEDLN